MVPTDDHRGLSDRRFGLTFAGIFIGMSALRRVVAGAFPQWMLLLACCFAFFAIVAPSALMPLNRMWQRLTRRIGIINSHVVLSVVFYAAIWPIGAVLRLFGHDPMSLSGSRSGETYLTAVRRDAGPETFHDQF